MITNVTLTTKERFLLEDQKSHEEMCILKYSNYANLACDQQLKDIFTNHAQKEQQHLDTINQLLSGKVPDMNSGSQSNSSQKSGNSSNSNSSNNNSGGFQASDKELCTDMLMAEKYVSGAYNTAIFEFKDTEVRNVLNHIQKEEQEHGDAIFKYMQSNGMYDVK